MAKDLPHVWLETINDIIANGARIAPRGQPTREILQRTVEIDMRRPVLTIPQRKLSYKFMAAEAYWILTGDDRVETIAPYNKNISQFSDDGKIFFGAYGPKIMKQMDYVVDKLKQDSDTRQAGLTIWRESPPETKDVPCTVTIFFNIRGGKLNCHVFMRSSDVWLGLPYDAFNFSMLSHLVCCYLNQENLAVEPGTLYLTAASSHLYERNLEAATVCLIAETIEQRETPEASFNDSCVLMGLLANLRTSESGDYLRWWEA